MSSIHANSAPDALAKLATLPLLAGRNIDAGFVVPAVASSIDVVVHCELARGGRRRVIEIAAPTGAVLDGVVQAQPIVAIRRDRLEATGIHPARLSKFRAAGLDPVAVLGTPR